MDPYLLPTPRLSRGTNLILIIFSDVSFLSLSLSLSLSFSSPRSPWQFGCVPEVSAPHVSQVRHGCFFCVWFCALVSCRVQSHVSGFILVRLVVFVDAATGGVAAASGSVGDHDSVHAGNYDTAHCAAVALQLMFCVVCGLLCIADCADIW